MTIDVYTATGCEYCEALKGWISNAGSGVSSKVTIHTDEGTGGCGNGTVPCTIINGTCYSYSGGCDNSCQWSHIQSAVSSAPAATPAKPATTTSTAGSTATNETTTTPAWKTTIWSNEITVDWGAANPRPTIAETPGGWEPADVTLTPILPLPPPMTTGLTVALRNHKKLPIGRKVA